MQTLDYHVAVSVDGCIAHSDGTFGSFTFDEAVVNDFLESVGHYQMVLMGRKTYDVGLREGVTNPYPGKEQIVFSKTLLQSPDPAVKVTSQNPVEVVSALKKEGQRIWLCGGGQLAGQLMEAGLIDNIILKLNPITIGNGIPLLGGGELMSQLKLTKMKAYECGIVLLHYKVNNQSAPGGAD